MNIKRIGIIALQSILIIAVSAVIAFSPALAVKQMARADTTTTTPTPTVSVNGTGKITVKPTIARIDFSVFTHDDVANVAQSSNDVVMAKITAALKKAGIAAEDIQTSGYSLQPRWVWDKTNEKNIQSGYDMNHNITVTVRTIANAGKIVSLVADNGANTVDGISFDVDDATLEQTKLVALDIAMANARKKADVVAKSAGRTILSVQTVNVNENSYVLRQTYSAKDSAVSGSAPAPVEAGTVDVEMSVSVTYIF